MHSISDHTRKSKISDELVKFRVLNYSKPQLFAKDFAADNTPINNKKNK